MYKIPQLFGLSQQDNLQLYQDVDIGNTLQNDNEVKDTLITKVNKSKISIKVKDTPQCKVITFTRGKIFNKQNITFRVLHDHEKYLQGLLELEATFKTFLDSFDQEESEYADIGYEIYQSTFQTRSLDTLPETMYHIQSVFTRNPSMWLRFKRLFAIIDVFIDPLIISTLKYKMLIYLQSQRRIILNINEPDNESLVSVFPDSEMHKLLDMFVFLPYGYLFFLFKHLNISNGMNIIMKDLTETE